MDRIIDKRIFDLISSISADIAKDWTDEAMAAHAELSVPYFRKLFKQEMGTPPITWLHNRRLEKLRYFY